MTWQPKCQHCGRFHSAEPGSAWKMLYSGVPPTPDRSITRCKHCVEQWGAFEPQSGIRPEASCGIVPASQGQEGQ